MRNSRDAIIMGVDRLGHGVLLAEDIVTLEYAAKMQQPVEVNLSSNLRLTKISQVSEHPFLKYLRLGLAVSLSTDDEGIFETDINHECELAVNQTDISYTEVKQLAFNSIQTSFANEKDKSALKIQLIESFSKFENDSRWPIF